AEFTAQGRLAVAADGQGFQAQLHWLQQGDTAEVSLQGPLGVGGVHLRLIGERLQLRLSDGRQVAGDAALAELERRVGAALPLAALRYWLLGVPQPGAPAFEELLDRHSGKRPLPAQLAALEQYGWRASYPPHAGLPRQLRLEGGSAIVRVAIDHWRWRAR
ncbi:MAG: outer membrane lipoprotein LolB, partial [Steroidobacteraceae bacterium]|nr:outer membrane lipoprotein LolB [Steroidobacteraceae bacterium]MDW8258847.1 outer membrane lipoprotein LolB [Gammaproteobacteria bacterium]